MSHEARPALTVRALREADLDAVVSIDAAIVGRSRRSYFQRRLASSLKAPDQHVQFAAEIGGALAAYVLVRRVHGEFGRPLDGLRIEALGVEPRWRGTGVGRAMVNALAAYGRRHGAAELRTTAAWNQHAMLRWFDACAFTLDPSRIFECAVGDGFQAERDDALDATAGAGARREIDYGATEGNDFERAQRLGCEVGTMTSADLGPIVRIDSEVTGSNRAEYIGAKLSEALDDAAIRVSLTARMDGTIVGFVMARADIGDFGRAEPVAVLDTIGVDPAYGRRGIGHALVSQLFADLAALQVDRVETVIAPEQRELLYFMQSIGFRPSQRLAFVRPLG